MILMTLHQDQQLLAIFQAGGAKGKPGANKSSRASRLIFHAAVHSLFVGDEECRTRKIMAILWLNWQTDRRFTYMSAQYLSLPSEQNELSAMVNKLHHDNLARAHGTKSTPSYKQGVGWRNTSSLLLSIHQSRVMQNNETRQKKSWNVQK